MRTALHELLRQTVEMKGSDLHLVVGRPPTVRVTGVLQALDLPALNVDEVRELLFLMLDEKQQAELIREWELDFSYSVSGLSRFRGSAIVQRGSYDVVLRVVPFKVPKVEELGLPEVVK